MEQIRPQPPKFREPRQNGYESHPSNPQIDLADGLLGEIPKPTAEDEALAAGVFKGITGGKEYGTKTQDQDVIRGIETATTKTKAKAFEDGWANRVGQTISTNESRRDLKNERQAIDTERKMAEEASPRREALRKMAETNIIAERDRLSKLREENERAKKLAEAQRLLEIQKARETIRGQKTANTMSEPPIIQNALEIATGQPIKTTEITQPAKLERSAKDIRAEKAKELKDFFAVLKDLRREVGQIKIGLLWGKLEGKFNGKLGQTDEVYLSDPNNDEGLLISGSDEILAKLQKKNPEAANTVDKYLNFVVQFQKQRAKLSSFSDRLANKATDSIQARQDKYRQEMGRAGSTTRTGF